MYFSGESIGSFHPILKEFHDSENKIVKMKETGVGNGEALTHWSQREEQPDESWGQTLMGTSHAVPTRSVPRGIQTLSGSAPFVQMKS